MIPNVKLISKNEVVFEDVDLLSGFEHNHNYYIKTGYDIAYDVNLHELRTFIKNQYVKPVKTTVDIKMEI